MPDLRSAHRALLAGSRQFNNQTRTDIPRTLSQAVKRLPQSTKHQCKQVVTLRTDNTGDHDALTCTREICGMKCAGCVHTTLLSYPHCFATIGVLPLRQATQPAESTPVAVDLFHSASVPTAVRLTWLCGPFDCLCRDCSPCMHVSSRRPPCASTLADLVAWNHRNTEVKAVNT
jgi:hypothetical protein